MPAGDPSIDALLGAARVQYAASLPAKLAAIEASVARAAWGDVRRDVHKLRGSAATYGFVGLGVAAGAIEDLLIASDPPDADARARIAERLLEARAEVGRASPGAP